MAGDTSRKGLKSVAGQRPLRSRGFLSQPAGQTTETAGNDSAGADIRTRHRSRGKRQAVVASDARPQDLSPKPAIKPYTLEEE